MTREQQLELECYELNMRLADMTALASQLKSQLLKLNLEQKRADFSKTPDAEKPKIKEEATPPGVD